VTFHMERYDRVDPESAPDGDTLMGKRRKVEMALSKEEKNGGGESMALTQGLD